MGNDQIDVPSKDDLVEHLAFLHELMAMRENVGPRRGRWNESIDALTVALKKLHLHVGDVLRDVRPEALSAVDPVYRDEDGPALFVRLTSTSRTTVEAALRYRRSDFERLGLLPSVELAYEIREMITRARKYEREGD